MRLINRLTARCALVAVMVASVPAVPMASAVTASVSHARVAFTAPRLAARLGTRIKLQGTVKGVALGSADVMKIRVSRYAGGKWHLRRTITPDRTRLSSTSTSWKLSVKLKERGSYKAQAMLRAGDGRFTITYSKPVTFRIVSKRYIALTFEDGPWPRTTDRIRKALSTQHARATFFMIGEALKSNRAIARRVTRAGYAVGVHTMTHPNLAGLSSGGIRRQLNQCRALIRKVTGRKATWYRPPGGSTSPRVRRVAKSLGLREIIWTVDTNDWRRPSAAVIRARAVRGARPGAVVLMHDGGGNRTHTAAAVPGILRDLKARRYDFVTMDEWAALR